MRFQIADKLNQKLLCLYYSTLEVRGLGRGRNRKPYSTRSGNMDVCYPKDQEVLLLMFPFAKETLHALLTLQFRMSLPKSVVFL